jgi:hypothetical protein
VWEVAKLIRGARARVVVAGPMFIYTMMGDLVKAAMRGVEVKIIVSPTISDAKAWAKVLGSSRRDWLINLIYFALLIIIMVASYLMRLPSSLTLFMGLALAIGFMMYMFRDFIVPVLRVKPRGFTVNALKNRKTALAILLITAIGGFIIGLGFLAGYLLRSSLFTWLIVGFGVFYLSLSYHSILAEATQPLRINIIKAQKGLDKTIIIIDNEAWVGDEKCMSRTNPEDALKLIE